MDQDKINLIITMVKRSIPSYVTNDPEPMEVGIYEKENGTVWYWVKPSQALALVFTDAKNNKKHWDEIEEWCDKTFGERDIWAQTTADRGWSASNKKYYFLKESDRTLFILKWCS